MKKNRLPIIAIILIAFTTNINCQQISDGYAPPISDFSAILKSGVYTGSSPNGSIPDGTWQHLFVIRHGNANNNYQLQLGSSIYENDRLFFRKIADAGLNTRNPQWIELSTRGSNNFIGNQTINGSVGIGTTTPGDASLKIYKSENPYLELTSSFSNLQLAMASADWAWANGSKKGDAVFRTRGGDHHGLVFFMNNNNNDGASYIKFGDGANNLWFGIMNNRTVRIDGSVYAKELTIQANVWADDVFSPSYKLMPLSEIETFVNTNKHLPGVPSEIEVKEEGVNVAKMNEILLRKVEELTLHVIEQQKKIKELELQISKL